MATSQQGPSQQGQAQRPMPLEDRAEAEPAGEESFETLFARLEEISERLEAGGLTLEQSVSLYEEGMRLAERCQAMLGQVEQRIETLRRRVTGNGEDPR